MRKTWSFALGALGLAGALMAAEKIDGGPPLANDFGPKEIDVSSYPEGLQEGYKLLTQKCAKCHSYTRALNAQYVQPEGDADAQKTAIEGLKQSNPELFADKNVWVVEAEVWKRYVKRMMAKPGSDIAKEDAKKIYEFLAYDSHTRKLKDPKAWTAARKKMLDEFQKQHPEAYKTTYAAK